MTNTFYWDPETEEIVEEDGVAECVVGYAKCQEEFDSWLEESGSTTEES